MSNATHEMLQKIATRELDKASEQLALANKQVNEAKTQLELLKNYREENLTRYNEALSVGMSIDLLQNYQRFLLKLDQAISGQNATVDNLLNLSKNQLAIWQSCQMKKLSYDVMANRAQQRSKLMELKHDQKMMDEYASRSKKSAYL
jgi:flagellar FliJ protein